MKTEEASETKRLTELKFREKQIKEHLKAIKMDMQKELKDLKKKEKGIPEQNQSLMIKLGDTHMTKINKIYQKM